MSDKGDDPQGPEGSQDPLGDLFRAMFGEAGAAGLTGEGGAGLSLPPGLAGLPGVPNDPAALQAMLAQVQQLLAGSGEGPVNWDLAQDVARQVASEGSDPSIGAQQQRQVAEALRTADLWLDRVAALPAAAGRTDAWSRAEWVEGTLPTWKGIVEPVAVSVVDAMGRVMSEQAPPELQPMLAGALPMMRRMGGAFFGAQVGQAIGALAREVLGSGDVGVPLLPAGRMALLPTNVREFGEGLDLPEDEVRLYLALREAAHARLFAGVGWLRAHLLGALQDYARGIRIDTDRIEEAIREVDPSDPEALQGALSSGLFEPQRTPAQQAALDRLETALALVEGWVDEVVDAAARGSLPHSGALRETVRRRRAVGGPAEHTFASLVGLELRPRRLRDAAAVWAALTAARGVDGRDALWAHPDLVPTAQAFADPVGFARPDAAEQSGDAMDAALAELLDSAERSESAGTGSPEGGTGSSTGTAGSGSAEGGTGSAEGGTGSSGGAGSSGGGGPAGGGGPEPEPGR